MLKRHAFLTALCALAPVGALAQPSEPYATEPQSQGETIILSPFEVSSTNPARYQAAETASGGRIATSIMDTPTTVSVLTSDFLADVGGSRVLEASKYVAGVSESTIPNGLDRITIRGFQTDGRRMDGFSYGGQANYDHGAVDRVEVVKGPDALLQPAGVPGGTINLVSKRPQWAFGGSLKVQIGEYDTNRVEADVTGPINEHFAYRVVAALQDNESWVDNTFRESFLLTPSLTWRISPQANLTLRYEYYDFKGSNLEGLPVDPSVGTNTGFKTIESLPLRFNPAPGKHYSFRKSTSHALTAFFTSAITDRLSVRLAGRLAEVDTPDSDFRIGLSAPGGSRNPHTGQWEPGNNWQNVSADPLSPDWQALPAAQPTNVFTHAGTYSDNINHYRDLQNDWSYIIDGDMVKSTTMIGFAYGYEHNNRRVNTQALPDFTLAGFVRPGAPTIIGPLSGDYRFQYSRYQSYLNQSVAFLDGRLILSGGVAHLTFNGVYGNKLSAASGTKVAGQMFPGSGSKATYNYGFVVKPIETLSVYYGHTENAVPANNFEQVYDGRDPFSAGTQDELGLKLRLFNGRILASVAYYEIEQTGYTVFNPLNLSVPPPSPLHPDLVLSREARGWEYQITGSITESVSIMASYADTRNRDPNGILLRGSAEDMGAVFLRYEFRNDALRGLSLGLGSNYMSKCSVENVSGFTALAIPNQPSAYLPAVTLTNAYASYTRGALTYRLDVTNLTDETVYSALSRNLVMIGNPRAFSGSVTWKF